MCTQAAHASAHANMRGRLLLQRCDVVWLLCIAVIGSALTHRHNRRLSVDNISEGNTYKGSGRHGESVRERDRGYGRVLEGSG